VRIVNDLPFQLAAGNEKNKDVLPLSFSVVTSQFYGAVVVF
jgi:hypothetical protein